MLVLKVCNRLEFGKMSRKDFLCMKNLCKKHGHQEFDHESTLIRIKQSKFLTLVDITGNMIKMLIFLTFTMSLSDKTVCKSCTYCSICVD